MIPAPDGTGLHYSVGADNMRNKSTPAFLCLCGHPEGSTSKFWQKRLGHYSEKSNGLGCGGVLLINLTETRVVKGTQVQAVLKALKMKGTFPSIFPFSSSVSLCLCLLSLPLSMLTEAGFGSSFILLISTHTPWFCLCMDHYTFRLSLLKHIILDYRNDSVFLVKEGKFDNFPHKQKPLWMSSFPFSRTCVPLPILPTALTQFLGFPCKCFWCSL